MYNWEKTWARLMVFLFKTIKNASKKNAIYLLNGKRSYFQYFILQHFSIENYVLVHCTEHTKVPYPMGYESHYSDVASKSLQFGINIMDSVAIDWPRALNLTLSAIEIYNCANEVIISRSNHAILTLCNSFP